MISPVLAELRPGQKQVFRIAQRKGAASPRERAYRLILEDVADTPSEESGLAIRFRMRYDLAVLVAPATKPVASLHWKPCAATPAGACLRVINAGNRRVKLQALQVQGTGWSGHLAFKDGANLLAGAEREWRVPAAQPGEVRSANAVTVQGEKVTLEPASH
jgi:fimbrial chaperone protein